MVRNKTLQKEYKVERTFLISSDPSLLIYSPSHVESLVICD